MMFSSPGVDAGGKSELELTMSQSSWSSQRIPESKKRKASRHSTMDPPPKRKMTALETKLAELRKILKDLPSSWKPYDPGSFMEEMVRLRVKFNELAPDMIGQYITSGGVEKDRFTLDEQEDSLNAAPKSSTTTSTITSTPLERTQSARSLMIAHVQQVRTSLEGQSFLFFIFYFLFFIFYFLFIYFILFYFILPLGRC
jgi:hypothetical protein